MASIGRIAREVVPSFCKVFAQRTATTVKQPFTRAPHFRKIHHRRFCSGKPLLEKKTVSVSFSPVNGDKVSVDAKVGDTLYDVIIDNDIEFDGFGACEATLACSTCHLIFTPAQFEAIGDKPSDEESDMLDLAYGLCDTSRLGCQVIVTEDMEGWEIEVPEGVADAREP